MEKMSGKPGSSVLSEKSVADYLGYLQRYEDFHKERGLQTGPNDTPRFEEIGSFVQSLTQGSAGAAKSALKFMFKSKLPDVQDSAWRMLRGKGAAAEGANLRKNQPGAIMHADLTAWFVLMET